MAALMSSATLRYREGGRTTPRSAAMKAERNGQRPDRHIAPGLTRNRYGAGHSRLRHPAPASAGLEREVRQRRRRQRVAGIAVDGPEASGHPVLPGLLDVLAGAGDEVPPHQQALAERDAADHEEPGQ